MIDPNAASRLKEVLKEYDGSQQELADICGISQPSLSRMAAGTQTITLSVIKGLAVNLGYNAMWLINGDMPRKNYNLKPGVSKRDADLLGLEDRVKRIEKHLNL